MSMPSRMGGAAHFGDKPIGVGESGPIKLEPFLYCNELRGRPSRKLLYQKRAESAGVAHGTQFAALVTNIRRRLF
jgi:hypothetical protein